MQILLNGEAHDLPDRITALALLEQQGLADRRVAVEINLEIIPRSAYAQTELRHGDRVEIVRAIGGG
ncbi:MAG: sulfur carrier protein ThiS [Thiotrichales bacterium]